MWELISYFEFDALIMLGVTGETSEKELDNFRQHGASRVLMKPVDIDIINETFKELKLIK